MCDHEVIGLILQSDINTAAALLGYDVGKLFNS